MHSMETYVVAVDGLAFNVDPYVSLVFKTQVSVTSATGSFVLSLIPVFHKFSPSLSTVINIPSILVVLWSFNDESPTIQTRTDGKFPSIFYPSLLIFLFFLFKLIKCRKYGGTAMYCIDSFRDPKPQRLVQQFYYVDELPLSPVMHDNQSDFHITQEFVPDGDTSCSLLPARLF